MKISIDASGLGQAKTGTTVYLTQILAQWNCDKGVAHTFVIFVAPKARHHLTALDLDERFYDTPDHQVPGHETWHDVQLMLRGPVAQDAKAQESTQ